MEGCGSSDARFTQQFVNANSIAWRSPIDKNVNFFNQEFIAAPVQAYTENGCMSVQQLGHLLEQLPPSAKLESVESYGTTNEVMTWKYDESSVSEGTPFLTLDDKEGAIDLKRQIYSDLMMSRATSVKNGKSEALLRVVQGEDSVWMIWEITEASVTSLSEQFDLTDQGFQIVPVQVTKGGPVKFLLALNVYHSQIDGDPNGQVVRYEWSIFVKEAANLGGGLIPAHHMIIKAGSSADTLDPVHGNVAATPAALERDGTVVKLVANTLNATLRIDTDSLATDRDWILANGRVYWTNGVYDVLYFDSSLINQQPRAASVDTITKSDDFEWGHILNGDEPLTFVYEESSTYIVSPWHNMDDSNPLYETLKLTMFSSMAEFSSHAVKSGSQQPLVDVKVYGDCEALPRLIINYAVPEESVAEFTRFLMLPNESSLAPLRLTSESSSSYMLTLSILYEEFGLDIQPVNKAVWSTYIQDEGGQAFLYEFFVLLSGAGMDIEQGLTQPVKTFNVSLADDGVIKIAIQDQEVDLTATAPKRDESAEPLDLSEEWVSTHDRVYWKKGVYDKLYYNEQLAKARVIPIAVDQLSILQETPWMHLVEQEPFEAFHFLDDVAFVSAPWYNIEEIV